MSSENVSKDVLVGVELSTGQVEIVHNDNKSPLVENEQILF